MPDDPEGMDPEGSPPEPPDLGARRARALRKPHPDGRVGGALERRDGGRRRGPRLDAGHGSPLLPVHRNASAPGHRRSIAVPRPATPASSGSSCGTATRSSSSRRTSPGPMIRSWRACPTKSPPWSRFRCVSDGSVVALVVLLFEQPTDPGRGARAGSRNSWRTRPPALARSLRAERKTLGMLHAIERLTNLYDLSKAFGSTIEWAELTHLVVRKAADLADGGDGLALAAAGRRGRAGRLRLQRQLRCRERAGGGRRHDRRGRSRRPGQR